MAPAEAALVERAKAVPDPRKRRGIRYPLWQILVTALVCTLCGAFMATQMAEVAPRLSYLRDRFGIRKFPSHNTFSLVLSLVDWASLGDELIAFVNEKCPLDGPKIEGYGLSPIDGKAVRAAAAKSDGEKPVYLLNSMCGEGSICLKPIRVGDKENEIAAIPKALMYLDLAGKVVTIDAIGMQREIVSAICAKGGDFLIGVKENQPRLLACIKAEEARLRASGAFAKLRSAEATEKCHGRVERRLATVMRDTSFILREFGPSSEFCLAGSVLVVEKTVSVKVKGEWKSSETTSYMLSSLTKVTAAGMLKMKLLHWSIEMQHYVLDVFMGEDRMTARKANATQNFSTLKRFAMRLKDSTPETAKESHNNFFLLNSLDQTRLDRLLRIA